MKERVMKMFEVNEWGSDTELCKSKDDEPCFESGKCENCPFFIENIKKMLDK